MVWRWDNADPFGVGAPIESPVGAATFVYNLRFPGQLYDKETNTHYNHYRDYDPQTGRYVQSDPVGLNGGINTYGYVGGDPLGLIDAHGLQASCVNPENILQCEAAGMSMASARIDITKLVAAATTIAEFCAKCKATDSRSVAQAKAYAFAGIGFGSSSSSKTPWTMSNYPGGPSFKKSKVYAAFKNQYYSEYMGWTGEGRQAVEEHPFGHPDLDGGQNHDCPHFLAVDINGNEEEFPYKPGSN